MGRRSSGGGPRFRGTASSKNNDNIIADGIEIESENYSDHDTMSPDDEDDSYDNELDHGVIDDGGDLDDDDTSNDNMENIDETSSDMADAAEASSLSQSAPSTGKRGKKHLFKPPSAGEVAEFTETDQLFK
eukprot:UC4_evm1s1183